MRKYTSGATCAAGVALASLNDVLWVAFPGGGGLGGGPPNHKLNIMPVQPGAPNDSWSFDRLLVLEQETTNEQPALASFGGKLWLAWTGTDSVHRLNIMSIAVDSDNHATAETNSKFMFNWTAPGDPANWTATGGPALCTFASRLYLAFSGGGGLGGAQPNGAFNLAWSTDGSHWPQSQLTVFDQHHSLLSPALVELPQLYGEDSKLFISFTGTNNFLYLDDYQAHSQRPPLKNIKDGDFETSDYSPAVVAVRSPEGWSIVYLWTGFGSNRHIYTMGGLGYSDNTTYHEAVSETSAFGLAATYMNSKYYVAWAGTDGVHRLNIADYGTLQRIPS